MPSWTPAPYSLPYITGQDVLEQTPSTNEAQIRKIAQYLEQIDSSTSAISDRLDAVDTQINNLSPSLAGPYTWSPGNFAIGTHNLTAFAFNGKVGDVWTGHFSIGIADKGGSGGVGWVGVRLKLASGIPLYNPTQGGHSFETATSDAIDYISWAWQATQANDYLIVEILVNPYGTVDGHIQASAINHGQS